MSDVQYQLRNVSIVLIVFGALAIALGIIDIVTGAGPWSLAGLSGYFVWAGILGIAQGIYQVIVGWIGCTKVRHPEHIGAFYILTLINFVCALLSCVIYCICVAGGDPVGVSIASEVINVFIAAWAVWIASKIRVFENPMLRNG